MRHKLDWQIKVVKVIWQAFGCQCLHEHIGVSNLIRTSNKVVLLSSIINASHGESGGSMGAEGSQEACKRAARTRETKGWHTFCREAEQTATWGFCAEQRWHCCASRQADFLHLSIHLIIFHKTYDSELSPNREKWRFSRRSWLSIHQSLLLPSFGTLRAASHKILLCTQIITFKLTVVVYNSHVSTLSVVLCQMSNTPFQLPVRSASNCQAALKHQIEGIWCHQALSRNHDRSRRYCTWWHVYATERLTSPHDICWGCQWTSNN